MIVPLFAGIQNGTFLTLHKVPGSFTGSFAGNLTSLQANYDQLVQDYFVVSYYQLLLQRMAQDLNDSNANVMRYLTVGT